MPGAAEYKKFLKGHKRSMIEELKRYCRIESCSRDKEGVDEVGSAVADAWEKLGFSSEVVGQEASGNHIIARRSGTGPGRLLCHMHLDTTQPKGTIEEQPVEERGDRVYGPGIHDMKGGWVVLLGAFRALDACGVRNLPTTTVFMCGDEELGSPTGRRYIEAEARNADWQVVMEPARKGGALCTARGAVGAVYLTVHGQFAPATSGEGRSAILEAAHLILQLNGLSQPERDRLVNVGIIEAGTARQAVPAKAWLSVDVRARNKYEGEELVRSIAEIANRNVVPGTNTVISGGITRPAFPRNAGNVGMFRIAQEVGKEIGLQISEAPTDRGGSDGSFGAAMGLASLDGLGVVGGQENGRQYIVANSLYERGALLAGTISRLSELL